MASEEQQVQEQSDIGTPRSEGLKNYEGIRRPEELAKGWAKGSCRVTLVGLLIRILHWYVEFSEESIRGTRNNKLLETSPRVSLHLTSEQALRNHIDHFENQFFDDRYF